MSKITVVRSVVSKPQGKNYEVCELAYKTDEGKTKGMKLFSFVAKDTFPVAAAAKTGDILEAQFKQSDKGFWEFASLTSTGEKAANEPVAASGGSTTGGISRSGNWETSDERAARQVLIVRQSSLSNAVAYFEAAKQKPSIQDVVEVAVSFEGYVLNGVVPLDKKTKQTGDVQ